MHPLSAQMHPLRTLALFWAQASFTVFARRHADLSRKYSREIMRIRRPNPLRYFVDTQLAGSK